MQISIEIINVQSTSKPTAKGSYTMLDVAFKRLDNGKIEGKKIMSFTNKEVYGILAKAGNGQQYTITTEKNANTGYWDWTEVTPMSGSNTPAASTAPASAGFSSPKSNYETSEERAFRQVLIVRQSSLSNAIDLLKNEKKPPALEEVLHVANIFSQWVYQKDVPMDKPVNLSEMDDDIPM